ncbi:hypothetical protein [Maribacter sp. 2307UL18-2]|uniref:hypothetical protein n=1 Tax=Maribacter sp. 2307UL18-2 TaxID=3386274 RepID=UPI0039BC60E9
MNKKLLLVIAFLALTSTFYGQRRPDREKLKSLKIAFLTERLDLSNDEAEAFWPAYNKHEERMNGFRKIERQEIRSKAMDFDALTEKEAEELLSKQMSLEAEKQTEQQAFVKKMKGILSAKKTIILLKSEEDFKRKLIQQYRQRRNGGGGFR